MKDIAPILVLFCVLIATPAIAIQNNTTTKLQSLIAEDAKPKLLSGGFKFTEGPAADSYGNIYFTDIGNNRIHYWNAITEKLSTIRENSGGADGMFVDRNGTLWICELKNKQLSNLTKNGDYKVILDSFQGKEFTGVNDLWIDSYGGIYFSDSYGGNQLKENNHRVFYYTPDGILKLVADNFYKSNGLQGTSNGKWLYVSDYIDNKVYRYELLEPGVVGKRTVFAEYRCDGMTLDEKGNLYISTGNSGHGVVVFSAKGEELGKISLPENPANICFGGADYKTLYITATHGFYSLDMKVSGNNNSSPQKKIFNDEGGLSVLLKKDALPQQLATGFKIAQGPATDPYGDVYFSDIFHNRILKWNFNNNALTLVKEQLKGPDGLFFEHDGSLLVCELTGKRFARLKPDNSYEIIATTFNNIPLTGANDVFVDKQGGIYFSDSYPGGNIREPEYCVYYIAPGGNKLKQIINDHYKTKGIHISADGDWIYIVDYGEQKVYRYKLLKPGVLGDKELFIDERCGGLTVDEQGNIYISTVNSHKGILVFNANGKKLGKIMFPEDTTNVTFGGKNRDKLIVTTFRSIYALDMNIKGMNYR